MFHQHFFYYSILSQQKTDGVRSFGDGRTFIVGTKGSIELRKTLDPAIPEKTRDVVIVLDDEGEHRYDVPHGDRLYPGHGRDYGLH